MGGLRLFSDRLREHFENPRHAGSLDSDDPRVGTGLAGAPRLATVIKLQIAVSDQGIIETIRFKTYGCGSAIACGSLLSEWADGKILAAAEAIEHARIAEELRLIPAKIYCSVLAVKALKAAIDDYRAKQRSKPAATH